MPLEVVEHNSEHRPRRLPAQGGGQFIGQGGLSGRGVTVDPHPCRMIKAQREDPVGQPVENLLPWRGHRRFVVKDRISTGTECPVYGHACKWLVLVPLRTL